MNKKHCPFPYANVCLEEAVRWGVRSINSRNLVEWLMTLALASQVLGFVLELFLHSLSSFTVCGVFC